MLRASGQSPESQANLRPDNTPAELVALHVPVEEWRAIVTLRPNVLAEGPDGSTEMLIRAVTSALPGPVDDWEHPSEDRQAGATLLVRHIDLLGTDEHRRLLDCINAEGARVHVRQIIATSTRPLFPLVTSGLFLSELYYRLNTIRLELGDTTPLG